MAHSTTTTAAAVHASRLRASATCLPNPLIKVSPDTFIELADELFSITHGIDSSQHVYFGYFLEQFVIYTRTPRQLNVAVAIEAQKISKTIRL